MDFKRMSYYQETKPKTLDEHTFKQACPGCLGEGGCDYCEGTTWIGFQCEMCTRKSLAGGVMHYVYTVDNEDFAELRAYCSPTCAHKYLRLLCLTVEEVANDCTLVTP